MHAPRFVSRLAPSLVWASLVATAAACGSSSGTGEAAGGAAGEGGAAGSGGSGGSGGAGGSATIGGDRPVVVTLPPGYDPAVPAPVLVLLHGYGASGAIQSLYMGVEPLAGERGMILAVPDGTIDASGKRFWNATDACCDFAGTGVDDSAYLASVLDELAAAYSVDSKRVYFLGHSNGGFMSYRMACDHADRIAAVASLAGAAVASAADCAPSEPVSVLQMHGTADDVIFYDGGLLVSEPYPSAADTVAHWAGYDACAGALEPVGTLDYESALPGAETTQADYAGCPGGAGVSLWTIEGGAHVPAFSEGAMPAALDWLLAHPKP